MRLPPVPTANYTPVPKTTLVRSDVLAARLEAEYNLAVRFEPAPFDAARWLDAGDAATLKGFADKNQANMAEDYDGAPVYLAKSGRSEEHTSELQSLMRISYAVFCLIKNKQTQYKTTSRTTH